VKLFSYIVKHDTGFAPNPFWGYCTLANCKPAIRRTAEPGDWIVGLNPKSHGNRIVFAMQVEETLPYSRYFLDKRFAEKVPDYSKNQCIFKCGDNIYNPLTDGGFRQLQSMHSDGERENQKNKAHDLGGTNVLVARHFHYFGRSGPKLPRHLKALKVGRGHRNRFSDKIIADFLEFIAGHPAGVTASPSVWPPHDDSWRQEQR